MKNFNFPARFRAISISTDVNNLQWCTTSRNGTPPLLVKRRRDPSVILILI